MINIVDICIVQCDHGWLTNSRRYYNDISESANDILCQDTKQKIQDLCKAGLETISPRFAYPHIREYLVKLKGK
jgi:hypothetical protein